MGRVRRSRVLVWYIGLFSYIYRSLFICTLSLFQYRVHGMGRVRMSRALVWYIGLFSYIYRSLFICRLALFQCIGKVWGEFVGLFYWSVIQVSFHTYIGLFFFIDVVYGSLFICTLFFVTYISLFPYIRRSLFICQLYVLTRICLFPYTRRSLFIYLLISFPIYIPLFAYVYRSLFRRNLSLSRRGWRVCTCVYACARVCASV